MNNGNGTRILDSIDSPADLKRLNLVELRRLAAEIRDEIISTTSKTGGHIAPSLGVVELTLALHYVFDTPEDQIVWDVGHQTYAHKLVTGRARRFATLRQKDGLSGFPKRAESPYDSFDTGHAGNAISVALGLSTGDSLTGRKRKSIAVVGDGSVVTGMAFEALNNAGGMKKDLIVVLNDNEMSIAKSEGGFADYLNRIITGRSYNLLRTDVWNMLGRLPSNLSGRTRLAVKKVEEGLKNLVAPSVIFEEMGFRYFGPFDGHNLIVLTDIFRKIKSIPGPILVHVVTRKGKGYPPAEQHPEKFHGAGKFDIASGDWVPTSQANFTNAFGAAMVELAQNNPKIVAVTAGMTLGTGLAEFRDRFPDRFFDTGITEQHAVTFAAGMALAGMRPVVAIYSTFLARGFDQIIQDLSLQRLPVVLAIDRAGLVGEDGPTHHGMLDLSFLRAVPGLTVMAPADEIELSQMLEFALQSRDLPVAIRYPKGGSGLKPDDARLTRGPIVEGQGQLVEQGSDIAILALGSMVVPALDAAAILRKQGISPTVVNMRFLKPLDTSLLKTVVENARMVFTLEENTVQGGFGSAVLEAVSTLGLKTQVRVIGLPDGFITHGTRSQLLELAGLDSSSIARKIAAELK